MLKLIKYFEKVVTLVLILFMALVVILSLYELGLILYKDIMTPPLGVLEINELIELFGFFLIVMIGVELLETMKDFLVYGHIRLNVIMAVALLAIGRKIIILDIEKYDPTTLIGLGIIILALVVGYWVARTIDNTK